MFASRFLVAGDRPPEIRMLQANGGPLPSIDDDPREGTGDPGSDHAAIVTSFHF